jgi:hypothetical protein
MRLDWSLVMKAAFLVFAFSWLVCDDLSSHLNSQQFDEFYVSENVYWVLEFAVDPGRFEELKTLMTELVKAARKNEVGMLAAAGQSKC